MPSHSLQFPAWRDAEPDPIVEWAERSVQLTATSRPGQLRMLPGQGPILEAMADPDVDEVDLMISSQFFKSTTLAIFLLWKIDVSPAQIMFMHATLTGLRKFNREKLSPTLNANPFIAAKVHRNNRNNLPPDGFAFDGGGFCTMVSEGSRSAQHGTTASLVIADEVDDYQNGDVVQNLRQRGITFDGKLICVSTPTEKDASPIQARYELGSQTWRFVPCPHCGFEQVLQDSQFIDGNLYCVSCAAVWTELQWFEALARGRYVEQNPNPRHKSFWLSQLYNPQVPLEKTWQAKQEYSERNYVTQVLAWPYEEVEVPPVKPEKIHRRERDWPETYRTVGVDVQGNRIEYAVVEFDQLLERKHIAKWGAILRQEGYGHWHELRAEVTDWDWMSVDGGYDFDHVQQGLFDAYSDRFLLPEPQIEIVRGLAGAGDNFDRPVRGGRGPGGYRWISTDEVKVLIAQDLTNGLLTLDPALPSGNDGAEAQLASEKVVRTQKTSGRIQRRWVKVSPKASNELLDMTGYAYSGALAMRALDMQGGG